MCPLRTGILQRDQITRTLKKSLSFPLLVLTAPMGYGKTTAAHAFMNAGSHQALYLTINAGENSAPYLWDRLCSQLIALGVPLGQLLRRMGFPQDNVQTDRVLKNIRQHLNAGPTILAIDDYHLACSPEFDSFLERLVKERLPGLTVLLISRTLPGRQTSEVQSPAPLIPDAPTPDTRNTSATIPAGANPLGLNLDELRLKGLACQFGQDLLAFSPDDTIEYFKLHGISDAASARSAWLKSEGWAAALWLCVQGYKTYNTATSSRDVESLLEHAVFSQYTAEDKRLLTHLSVLDSFTPEQAIAVSGDQTAPRRLIRLHEHNAFLSYDPVTDSYRLHSMFRTFLGKVLGDAPDIDKDTLYRRAGESFVAEGDMVKAAQAFAKAGKEEDSLRILELFESPKSGFLLIISPEAVLSIVQGIPWSLRYQRPVGYLAFIYFYLSQVSVPRALPLLEEAEQRFATEKTIPAAMRKRLKGEAVLIRSLLAFNDLHVMRDTHVQAHKLLKGKSAISSRHLIWTFGCPHVSYLYLRQTGSYGELVELVKNNLSYYQALSDGCSMGAEDLFRSEYLLERGEFAEVEKCLMKSIYLAGSREQLSTILAANFSLARLFITQGKNEEALALLRELAPKIHRTGSVALSNCLDLALGYIKACLGRYREIPGWLQEGNIPPSRNFYQILGFIYIVHGKALLLDENYSRLETLAQSLPAYLGPYQNLFAFIHAHTLEAIATQHLRGMDEAVPILHKAMELARADGICLSLAEYGRHILPILRRAQSQTPQDDYLTALLKQAESIAAHNAGTSNKGKGGKKERLTPRERELLHLAAKGKSNAGIAKYLGISQVTVAKTLSSAYMKLKAKNRAEAVRKLSERER